MRRQVITINKMLTILGIAPIFLASGAVQAQNVTVFHGLPPLPPNIPSLDQIPKDTVQTDGLLSVPSIQPPIREFNFEALPATAPTNTSSFSASSRQYRVEIANANLQILEATKQVEPSAFLKGDRIQAGSFARAENAQNLQRTLREKGISASVVEVSLNTTTPAMGSSVEEGGYFVAIPTRGDDAAAIKRQLRQAGINAGLMQERSAPRGEHIAIGPFANRQEAERINNLVRASSLDGRLYFQD